MTKSAEEQAAEIAARHLAAQQAAGYAPHQPEVSVVLETTSGEVRTHTWPAQPPKGPEILSHLLPDEPWFVFRAKDILSSFALEAYLDFVQKFDATGDISAQIAGAVTEFRAWQRAHPDKVKLPD